MTTFFSFFTKHPVPKKETLKGLLARPLSWHGVVLYALLGAIAVVAYLCILSINRQFLVKVPAYGGSITEGVIGAPHTINPVIATTTTDVSLTKLIFSGLMREDVDGTLVPDLATSYEISSDGRVYTFILPQKLKWSDNKPLTSADIAFTISKRALYDSTWQNISVSTPDPQTVIITLPEAREGFLAHTTLGIIPQHIWNDSTDEDFDTRAANLHPVGSGPYAYVSLRTSDGVPEELVLKRNRHYAHRAVYLDRYKIAFFANQQTLLAALARGSIDLTLAADAQTASAVDQETYSIEPVATPLMVGLFHSGSDPSSLGTRSIADALNRIVDKAGILAIVEHGYGILPDSAPALSREEALSLLGTLGYTSPNGVLEKNGNPLGFSIAVENDPTLLSTARTLADELGKLGIIVTIKAFDHGAFEDGIARTEYAVVLGAFAPQSIPRGYQPVLPLYTKARTLIRTYDLHLTLPPTLGSPEDRYAASADWHTQTDNIWKFFSNN